MTDLGEKIKEMGLDKSNFECFMESDFSNIVTATFFILWEEPD